MSIPPAAGYGATSSSALPNGPTTSPRQSTTWTLSRAASQILISLKPVQSTREPPTSDTAGPAELAVHLYALHLLNKLSASASSLISTDGVERGWAIRAAVSSQAERSRMADAIIRSVEEILAGAGREQDGGDEEDDELLDMLWRPWPIDKRRSASAVELLIPPHSSSESAHLLGHPLISAALDSAWRFGLPFDAPTSAKRAQRGSTYAFLRSTITPRRIHLYHLLSMLVLSGLCLRLSLQPGIRVSPHPGDGDGNLLLAPGDKGLSGSATTPKPGALETVTLIWIASDLGSSFTHRFNISRILILSPLYLVLAAAYFSPPTAFTLLTISLPCLTTLLVLPHYPSFALLGASSGSATSPLSPLRLSCILSSALRRLARPFILLSPLILALLAVFSYAMNGDLSRGVVASAHAPPTEAGVAPYQTRVALFVSILLLLVYAIIAGAAGKRTSDGRRGGESEREHGDTAVARQEFAWAVLFGLGKSTTMPRAQRSATLPPSDSSEGADEESRLLTQSTGETHQTPSRRLGAAACPIPLDQLFFPLDIAQAIVAGAAAFGWEGAEVWTARLAGMGEMAVVLLMGPLCMMVIPIHRILGKVGWD